jgi:Ca2+-transporting ATPase
MAVGTQPDDWHAHTLPQLWSTVESREHGLTAVEAMERRRRFGPNRLPQQPPQTPWQIFLRQFRSPLIYILMVSALVSLWVQDYEDATFIAVVLLMNAAIGGYQEWRAERSNQALQQLLRIRASVERDGLITEVDAEELTIGDVVWLESGNRVPADLRLVSAHGLEVDESLLTGESLPVPKDASWLGISTTPVADRKNLAFAASIVARGRAKGVVVGIGPQTIVGQLAVDVLHAVAGKPPLIERIERFSQTIAYGVMILVAAVFTFGIAVLGHSIHDMFLFGVALAVAAIPESLPAALTITLAVAKNRMARHNVIVRSLAAVEGLGSCTLIASDKTGTLTCNELTVRHIQLADGMQLDVSGEGFTPEGNLLADGRTLQATDYPPLAKLIEAALLCNEADLHRHEKNWVWRGDPTDIALLSLGVKAGMQRAELLDQRPMLAAIPFEPERQFAATFHRSPATSAIHVYVKGAPERVLPMCHGEPAEQSFRYQAMQEAMAARGYRVLAIADGPVGESPERWDAETPSPPTCLSFRGLVGMIDPLRPGVREAIGKCQQAGIEVCMVTGDHPVTALAIARDLGLANHAEQVITGEEIDRQSPAELQRLLHQARVFARVAPRQKLQLVMAGQANGHFVAVTGDGVNDAPALQAANIGVAMGKSGTDVAREAADLVISDDNFSSIVTGVELGRAAYDNIRKVIYLLVSTGVAEILIVMVAFAFGRSLPLPFLAVQLLWLNLVTNGIQDVSLAFEPGEEGLLQRRPRDPSEPIFNRLMIERTILAALVMAVVGASSFAWMIHHGWSDRSARNALLLLMVLFENIHIGNCRSESRSAFFLSPLRSPMLLLGVIAALLIHVLAMYTPFLQSVLQTEPVSLQTWCVLCGLALTVSIAVELHKWTWRWRGFR